MTKASTATRTTVAPCTSPRAPVPLGFDAVVPIERVRFPGGPRPWPSRGGPRSAPARTCARWARTSSEARCCFTRATESAAHELGIAALAGVSEASTSTIRRIVREVLEQGTSRHPFADGLFSSRTPPPPAGLIFDANRHMLLACAREAGARVMDLGIARDDPDALADAIARAVDAGAGRRRRVPAASRGRQGSLERNAARVVWASRGRGALRAGHDEAGEALDVRGDFPNRGRFNGGRFGGRFGNPRPTLAKGNEGRKRKPSSRLVCRGTR